MTTYHAKRLNGPHGDGWYVVKLENGAEKILDHFFCGDFPESRFEAESIAKRQARFHGQSEPYLVRQHYRTRRESNG